MSKSNIERINKNAAAIHTTTGVYAVSLNTADNDWQTMMSSANKVDWEKDPQMVMGKRIVPYGENNNLPVMIRDIMDDNNLAPGILEREMGLLYGDGPQLYRVKYENGEVIREYVRDPEIWRWLHSWNIRRYIDMAMVEYKHLKGFFVRRYRNRGARIGKNAFIASLEVVTATDARLAWPEKGRRLEDVTTMYTGDFENNCMQTGITAYPVFDHRDPFRFPVAMSYHNSYSFARNFYSVPTYYGSLKWIMRSSDIPDIIKYLTDNGISVAFHVHSPAGYWDEKKRQLEDQYQDDSEPQILKRLDDLKDLTFETMSKVLAGKKNAGKFIETVDFIDQVTGVQCSWKIEPIEQKIKEFIDAQLKISEKADSATTSGMGLHPSLSNIVVNGQLSSGSQMLYAMKLYLASDTTIPEEVIFEPINQAIEVNFPGKDIKLGFYHKIVMKEEDVSPDKRVTNNA